MTAMERFACILVVFAALELARAWGGTWAAVGVGAALVVIGCGLDIRIGRHRREAR